MRGKYGEPLRKWLKIKCIIEILDFGDLPVFKKATTYPSIIIVKKSKPGYKFKAVNIKTLEPTRINEQIKEDNPGILKIYE